MRRASPPEESPSEAEPVRAGGDGVAKHALLNSKSIPKNLDKIIGMFKDSDPLLNLRALLVGRIG